MKRVVVLVLVLAVSVSMFAVPVSAEDNDNDTWVNIFDICELNPSFVSSDGLMEHSLDITFPTTISIYSFDLTFVDNLGYLSDYLTYIDFCDDNDRYYDVDYELIGDDVYRVYGSCDLSDYFSCVDFYLSFGLDSYNVMDISFLSFYVNIAPVNYWEIECYCDILAYGYGNTIHYVPTDKINYREWTASDYYDNPFLQLDLYCSDWNKYDYIDYCITMTCLSFTSITAFQDGVQLPISYTLTDNSSVGAHTYTLTIRLDLRGLDRSNSSFPNIHIEAQQSPGGNNMVSILSCVGGVVTDLGDSEISWLKIIWNKLIGGFNNLSGRLQMIYNMLNSMAGDSSSADNSFAADVQNKNIKLGDLNDSLNAIDRPELDSVQSDVSALVSSNDIILASSGIGSLVSNDIIFSIFSMSLVLCLASYVFFGKK